MREKSFENKIKNFLDSIGAVWYKQFGCSYTKAGTPDLLCCVNGHFVAVEVKAENGRPSPLQLYNIDKISKAGGVVYILYPKDFDKFKQDMEKLNGTK